MRHSVRNLIAEVLRDDAILNVRARWQWREFLGDYYPLVQANLNTVKGILYEYRKEPWGTVYEVMETNGTLKIASSTAESPAQWEDIPLEECQLCEISADGIQTLKRLIGTVSDARNSANTLPSYIITNAEGVAYHISSDFSTVTELRKGKPLKNKTDLLRPLASAYLGFLVENAGHTVTRDELVTYATHRFIILNKPLPRELRIYDAFRISKTEGKRQVGIYSAFEIKSGWDSNSTYILPLDKLKKE